MTAVTLNPAEFLDELQALEPLARDLRLAETKDVDAVLLALGDEAEGLVMVEVARAVRAARLVITLADKLGSPAAQSRARRALGQGLAYSGAFDEALEACHAAVSIATEASESVHAARAHLASIHALGELSRYEEAMTAGTTAREILITNGEPALAARADLNLGVVERKRGRPQAALVHFDRAKELLAGEPVILAQLESNRGEALLELDELRGSERAFKSALGTFEQVGHDWGAAIVEGNLADLATRQGRYSEALHYFESARSRIERDESPSHHARLLLEQADAKRLVGLPDDAASDYRQAMELLVLQEMPAEFARASTGLGHLAMGRGRWEEADDRFEAARHVLSDHPAALARLDLAQSDLALLMGDAESARSRLSAALKTLSPSSIDWALAQYRLVRLEAREGSTPATDHLDQAIQLLLHLHVTPAAADLLTLRGECHLRRNEAKEGIDDLRTSVSLFERTRGLLQADRFRAAFLAERLRAYELLTTALLDQDESGCLQEAFRTIELARSRSLLDAVTGTMELGLPADDATAADGLNGEFQRGIAQLNHLYSRIDDDSAAPSGLAEQISAVEREVSALELRLAARRGPVGLYAEPAVLDRVQASLASDTALIEYFVESDHLSAFIITADDVQVVRRHAPITQITDLVQKFRFQVGRVLRPGGLHKPRRDRLLNDIRLVLGDLHDSLIKPLLPMVGDVGNLAIVGTGLLHCLPLACLWDGQRFAVERWTITHLPSASVFCNLSERVPIAGGSSGGSLIVGVADERAPQIEEEARSISGSIPDSTLLLGAEATAETVMRELRYSKSAHLACHGRFDRNSPLSSGLRLADRWLTPRDIYHLDLPGTFITLSGCETGVSTVDSGDELVGLGRAFLAAGATGLAMSQWIVDDRVTTQLMLEFQRLLQSRDAATGPAQCMAIAQRRIISEHPHPAQWAPFIIMGEPG